MSSSPLSVGFSGKRWSFSPVLEHRPSFASTVPADLQRSRHPTTISPPLRLPLQLVCSSRNPGRPRGPLWRGRNLSNESLRAVQELKRAKGDLNRTSALFNTKISRLIKPDLLAVLAELQRQNECELALQIFDVIRKEIWYKPEATVFSDMVAMLGRNKLNEEVAKLCTIIHKEGPQPDARLYADMIGANLRSGNTTKAMELYDETKKQGYFPCELTYGIVLKGLNNNGELDLAAAVQTEYKEAQEAGLMAKATIS